MDAAAILKPVLVMGILNLVMLLWMYATRIPAMSKAGIAPEDARRDPEVMKRLPPQVTRVADNYNHLYEQPTLFYAIALTIAVLGHADALHVQCAWAYALLRIVHSGIQATVNHIPTRFAIFSLSWVALGIMILREAFRVF